MKIKVTPHNYQNWDVWILREDVESPYWQEFRLGFINEQAALRFALVLSSYKSAKEFHEKRSMDFYFKDGQQVLQEDCLIEESCKN